MKFFMDFNVDRNNKIGITNLLSNITIKPDSHKGGWARLLKCQLENEGYRNVEIIIKDDDLSNYDCVIFDLGAEFSGVLNLFGGLDDKVFNRLVQILAFKGHLFSWKNKLPDIEKALKGRENNKSTCESYKKQPKDFLSWVKDKLDLVQVFDHVSKKDHVLIGDSHTPGVWTPDMIIERQDGRTLYGSLSKNVLKELTDGKDYKSITVHLSSIDIRHHISRQENPMSTLHDLLFSLVNQLEALNIPNVTICHTMGIEDESRKLPKTGFYKGTPFYGSWVERNKLMELFNILVDEICQSRGWESLAYPEYFFDDEGKLSFDVMEKPSSVHISPEHYRWDLDNNKLRWIEDADRELEI